MEEGRERVAAHLSKALVPTAPQHVSHRDQRQDHAQASADKRHPCLQQLLNLFWLDHLDKTHDYCVSLPLLPGSFALRNP